MMQTLIILLFVYLGHVTDRQGTPLSYATIYPEMQPMLGTATGQDGEFRIDSEQEIYGEFIVSYIGYQKKAINAFYCLDHDTTIVLEEQPLALEEMVVSTKRQRNKRKMMKALLSEVHEQMIRDFGGKNTRYRIVSDVRLDQDSTTWGVEQLIASVWEWPYGCQNGRDSVWFWAESRKRYMIPGLREKADAFKHSEAIERMDKKGRKHYDLIWTVQNVDSGVVVHRSLWNIGGARRAFERHMDDVRHWTITNENEGETVLTHTEKKNFLGIFKYVNQVHFILESSSLSVKRTSMQSEVWVHMPFGGYKLNKDQLQFMALFNMSETEITRFRLRRAHAKILLNTLYTDDHRKLERNLVIDGEVEGSPKSTIQHMPIDVKATQRATYIQNL